MRRLDYLYELRKNLELNHWSVDDDHFAIALMRYYCDVDDTKSWPEVYLYVDGKKRLTMSFISVQYALQFVEEEINHSYSVAEIRRRFSIYKSLNYGNRIIDHKNKNYKGYKFDLDKIKDYTTLDDWSVCSDGYHITYMNLVCKINDALYYPEVYVISNGKVDLQMSFVDLETAVMFVEELEKLFTIDEVIEIYNEYEEDGLSVSFRDRRQIKSEEKMITKRKFYRYDKNNKKSNK